MNALKQLMDNYGYDAIAVIFIAFFGIIVVKSILNLFKKALVQSKIDRSLLSFIVAIVRILLYVLLLFVCLTRLHIPLTGIVSALSAVTLAIGLALQDIIGGVANGLLLVSARLFKVNDYIEVGDVSGSVKEINLLHTVLVTPDNKTVTIPNKTVFNTQIVNYSAYNERRLDITIGIDYDSDVEKAKTILLDLAKNNKKVLKNPEPMVVVKELKDSEITLLLRVWVKGDDYWPLTWYFNEEGLKALVDSGIEIPFNQLTVSYREEDKQ